MTSTLNGADLLGSGGHRWDWQGPRVIEKVLTTAGVQGATGVRTAGGATPVVITGRLRAASDAALLALKRSIAALCMARTEIAWTDDQGNSGDRLVITQTHWGRRTYAGDQVWLPYTILAEDRDGGSY